MQFVCDCASNTSKNPSIKNVCACTLLVYADAHKTDAHCWYNYVCMQFVRECASNTSKNPRECVCVTLLVYTLTDEHGTYAHC